MNQITNDYYTRHAAQFATETFNLSDSMQQLYNTFMHHLNGNCILDLGCGSGRDSVHFANNGYNVVSLEKNASLAKIASENGARNVVCRDIFDYNPSQKFDGIWACASLLHIDLLSLSLIFTKCACMLNDGGVLYCSFKYGGFEGVRNGRYFVDMTESKLKSIIDQVGCLDLIEMRVSEDVRSDTRQRWLNAYLCRR